MAAQLNSMIKILNYKLKKKKYDILSVGIGIDDGRALMVKAGYSGSGINDVIWMGDVVNTACHLANKAGRGIRNKIVVTEQIYNNLMIVTKSYYLNLLMEKPHCMKVILLERIWIMVQRKL